MQKDKIITFISGSEVIKGAFFATIRCSGPAKRRWSEDVEVGSDLGELQADEALRFW